MQNIINFMASYIITIPFLKKPFQDLKHPQRSYAMENAMNLQIALPNGQQHIGAWFLQPLKIQNRPLPKSDDEQYLSTQNHLIDENDTIILYLHGNAETRSQYHRRELYRLFQKMGFYVLAIDYRCYADSSKLLRPSQTSMVEDAQTAYDWILSKSHSHVNIFVWGHSLGTGVTSRLGQILSAKEELKPKGYILEAPFNCMKDEVESFKASKILTMLGMKVESILDGSDMLFDNALWLPQIQEPILILHAKDDEVIPFELAERLFENTKIQKENIEFIPFEANLQLRHDGIFKAIKTNLAIVTDFVQKVLSN